MSEVASVERSKTKGRQQRPVTGPIHETSNRVAELQVSGHLMTLETGLFCVFQSPGSPPTDPATGLPGVRITPAPGITGRSEAVSVSTFRDDGWMDGTAALVRVTDGAAQILVTIYQHKGKHAAPQLQVLRLSSDARAPATAGSPLTPVSLAAPGTSTAKPAPPNPEVMAHIQRMGDVGCMLGGWLGIKGSGQWVEGFGVAPGHGIAAEDVEYQAVLGRDWLSPWVESGKFCGSRGMALPLLGLKVRLKGAAAEAFECNYSATFVDGTAVGPVKGGEACEADSLAALEALQIVIKPRSSHTASAPKAELKAPAKAVPSMPAAKSPQGKFKSAPKLATRGKVKSKA